MNHRMSEVALRLHHCSNASLFDCVTVGLRHCRIASLCVYRNCAFEEAVQLSTSNELLILKVIPKHDPAVSVESKSFSTKSRSCSFDSSESLPNNLANIHAAVSSDYCQQQWIHYSQTRGVLVSRLINFILAESFDPEIHIV